MDLVLDGPAEAALLRLPDVVSDRVTTQLQRFADEPGLIRKSPMVILPDPAAGRVHYSIRLLVLVGDTEWMGNAPFELRSGSLVIRSIILEEF